MGFDVVCTDCGWKSADACKTCCQEQSAAQIAAPKLLWSSDIDLSDIKHFADPVERLAAYQAASHEHGVTFTNNDGMLFPEVF